MAHSGVRLKTFRFFWESLSIVKLGHRKRVSGSVSENKWSQIKSLGFRNFSLRKKASASVSENLITEKLSVSVLVKILVSSHTALCITFHCCNCNG